jgi:16S rRNA (cytidine1402-2'-O)-methyltransferase
MYKLYIVGTPIGNLEDMTMRAVRILKEVSLIAAEDTRNTSHLLKHFEIKTPTVSFHEYSDEKKVEFLLSKLEAGDVAIVTDAGMPCISDPGYELIKAASDRGVKVEVIPGPSASTAAVALSALSCEHFTFIGFLPRKQSDRLKILNEVKHYPHPLVFYEAPHRLNKTIRDIISVLGDRKVSVSREMTKIYEETYRGTLSSADAYFSDPRGEFAFVVDGWDAGSERSFGDIDALIKDAQSSGRSFKDSCQDLIDATGMSRRDIYKKWLSIEKE